MVRILLVICLVAVAGLALANEPLRVGLQTTGTVAWLMDVIRRHGLDRAAGFELTSVDLASPDAAKLALNGGAVDIAVTDWLWVARERALGARLQFYPYSTAVGAIMTKNESPLRAIADLKDHVLAVAGGPLDKSWLIVQAMAIREGVDLKHEARLQFGAPPLIFEKTLQGEPDAGLNFWNFCARLETQGFRRLLDVREAELKLDLKEPIALTGFAFSEDFVKAHKTTLERFIAATRKANEILLQSDAEWEALRPLMKAEDEATFSAYRERMREGVPRRPIEAEEADARVLFATLATIGGPALVGPASALDPGLYYHPAREGE
ncbi:MAG: ABC transporter substrate-binding protein [Roseiarcus sp.]|jgi:NitT/TauT family transport system substrate-binding protein